MKTLYLIGGTTGVGKTTVGQLLKKKLSRSVFLDGDWCWDADPFQVTEETKTMVLDNITHLLQGFLRCSAYETVIFVWVMHEQTIIDSILARLDTSGCAVHCVSLLSDEETLRERLRKDIAQGIRAEDVIGRSLDRLPQYGALDTAKIDTSILTPEEVAGRVAALAG